MMDINYYLNDGANWQAQAVLAYLRNNSIRVEDLTYDDEYKANIRVGRYENCREQGYVFTLLYKGIQRNYAVYEHRNSDSLIVLISNTFTINTPSIDDMYADKGENPSKYDYDKAFCYGQITECGDWILEDMYKTVAAEKTR